MGRELVRRLLLETDDHLDVLIRSSHDDLEVEDYLRDVVEIEPAPSVSRRVTVHAGDCAQACLGLSDGEFARLRREVSHIVHAAAVTRFDLPLDRARQLNTATVAHVLDLARSCPRLQGFFLLSTVYVAGRRVGTIRERESARPDGFVNTYEQSKYEGEELVAAAAGEVPGVVFRLSTLFGDSRSGRVTHFTAPHQALRIIYSGLASMLPGDPAGRVDLLPVDYAVRAMLAQGSRNILRLVIDRPVEAELLHHMAAFLGATSDTDRAGTLELCDLPHDLAHGAGRTGYGPTTCCWPASWARSSTSSASSRIPRISSAALSSSACPTTIGACPTSPSTSVRSSTTVWKRNGDAVCTEREQELIDFIRARARNRSATITPTTPLFKDRVLDSINILGLIGYVEARIGRKLSAREIVMANFASVRDVVRAFLV